MKQQKEGLTVEEGNKMIAEFMGAVIFDKIFDHLWKAVFNDNTPERTVYFANHLEYHSSWDWQIPVWSKVARLSQGLAMTEEQATRHNKLCDNYESSVFQNKPELGQKQLADFIQWYNQTQTQIKDNGK